MYGYIYKIICTAGSFSGRFYIGQRKWDGEISKDKYKGSGKILKDYYKKYPKAYIKEIIAIADSLEELDQLEKMYIRPHLYTEECLNVRDGGGRCHDYPMREETKKKLSESLKGRTVWNKGLKLPSSPMKGKHHTDETKKKISESKRGCVSPNKGKKLSEEHKAKLLAAHIGKPAWNKGLSPSEETRQLWSKMRTKYRILQLNKDTEEVIREYESVKLASEFTGVNKFSIYSCCEHNRSKTAGGYKWQFIIK